MKTFTMKAFGIACSLVLMTGLAACMSSGSSDSSDDVDEAVLTTTEAHNIGVEFNNAQNDAYEDIYKDFGDQIAAGASAMALDVTKASRSGVINLNRVFNCQVAGHITQTGTFNWTYVSPDGPDYVAPPISITIRGQLKQDVSDPTNNLNDCEQGSGIILDGTIYSDFTLDADADSVEAQLSTDGIIGINRRGQYGGLVMVADDCRIFFTVRAWASGGVSHGSANGTICDNSYSYSF